jgi:hypothetical protein
MVEYGNLRWYRRAGALAKARLVDFMHGGAAGDISLGAIKSLFQKGKLRVLIYSLSVLRVDLIYISRDPLQSYP